jgi:hypothetical protein
MEKLLYGKKGNLNTKRINKENKKKNSLLNTDRINDNILVTFNLLYGNNYISRNNNLNSKLNNENGDTIDDNENCFYK